MRVELKIDGGFAYIPGLARPVVVDAATLPAAEAATLNRLCAEAEACVAGSAAGAPPAMPDARRYRLVIEGEGRQREIVAADPVGLPPVAALIEFVRAHRTG